AGGATDQVVPGHRLLHLSGIEHILSWVLTAGRIEPRDPVRVVVRQSRWSMISTRTRDARMSLSTSAIAVTRRSRGGSVSGVKINARHQSGEARSGRFGYRSLAVAAP